MNKCPVCNLKVTDKAFKILMNRKHVCKSCGARLMLKYHLAFIGLYFIFSLTVPFLVFPESIWSVAAVFLSVFLGSFFFSQYKLPETGFDFIE